MAMPCGHRRDSKDQQLADHRAGRCGCCRTEMSTCPRSALTPHYHCDCCGECWVEVDGEVKWYVHG